MTPATRGKAGRKKAPAKATLDNPASPADAKYLKDFQKKCIARFDVAWVCKQLSDTDTIPSWYKTILTRMLVGWAVCPKKPGVRKALAWHHINNVAHKRATKLSDQATPYALAAITFLLTLHESRYRHIYGPLGGFNSLKKYSLFEFTALSKENAMAGKLCLQFIDILMHHAGPKQKQIDSLRFDRAKICMDHFNDIYTKKHKPGRLAKFKKENDVLDYEVTADSIFHPTSMYGEEPIGRKTFEGHWKECKISAEFIAALYCINVDTAKLYSSTQKTLHTKVRTNALDAIIHGSLERLPFSSKQFQMELIQRAHFFSQFLNDRRKQHQPFPTKLPMKPSELKILSPASLLKLDNMTASTKRKIS